MPVAKKLTQAKKLTTVRTVVSSPNMDDFEARVRAIVEPMMHSLELKIETSKLETIKWIIATSISVAAVLATTTGIAVTLILKAIK